jgi:uncharacterized membrane protein YkoI
MHGAHAASAPGVYAGMGLAWIGGGPMRGDDAGERQGISLEQATRIARSAYGGRVVSARASQRGGESGYQIRMVLDDGRVVNVFVDRHGRIR